MQASQLNRGIDCPVCDGTGDESGEAQSWGGTCPRCDGDGVVNRYLDGPDGEVLLSERYEDHGNFATYEEVTMPVRCEQMGGFEGRYGDWTPEDVTTEAMADYDDDLTDRLQNTHGENATEGGYELPDGNRLDESSLSDGWLDDDPSIDAIVEWLRARGDDADAEVMATIQRELSQ